MTARVTERFETARLTVVDEPVRRYFTQAIAKGAHLPRGALIRMHGRIDVRASSPGSRPASRRSSCSAA